VPVENSPEYEREVSRQRAAKRALAAKREGQDLLMRLRKSLALRTAADTEEFRRLEAANQQLLLLGQATTDSSGIVMKIKKPVARPLDHGVVRASSEIAEGANVEKGIRLKMPPTRAERLNALSNLSDLADTNVNATIAS
jgi:hypothetical protein